MLPFRYTLEFESHDRSSWRAGRRIDGDDVEFDAAFDDNESFDELLLRRPEVAQYVGTIDLQCLIPCQLGGDASANGEAQAAYGGLRFA